MPGAIVLWALVVATFGSALAETNDVAVRLRELYIQCVRTASLNDFAKAGQKQMAVEQAFQACATEEQAIAVFGRGTGVGSDVISQTIISLKLQLKRDIISRLP